MFVVCTNSDGLQKYVPELNRIPPAISYFFQQKNVMSVFFNIDFANYFIIFSPTLFKHQKPIYFLWNLNKSVSHF